MVTAMYDWRKYTRERYVGTIDVTVSVIKSNALERVRLNAETVDISQGGIGIVVETPLEGFVRLSGAAERKVGTVMWNRKLDNNKYRVGIRFDHLFSMNSKCQSEFPDVN
jgi:hypothetical protein